MPTLARKPMSACVRRSHHADDDLWIRLEAVGQGHVRSYLDVQVGNSGFQPFVERDRSSFSVSDTPFHKRAIGERFSEWGGPDGSSRERLSDWAAMCSLSRKRRPPEIPFNIVVGQRKPAVAHDPEYPAYVT